MWEELGISGGTAIIVLTALYFIIKWAVKNGIKEAYKEISDKEKRKRKKKGSNAATAILPTKCSTSITQSRSYR